MVTDIFYKEFIEEASAGRVNCGIYYNIVFDTAIFYDDKLVFLTKSKIDNPDLLIPTLVIHNKEQFDKLLTEFVDKCKSFYDFDGFEEIDNIDKAIIATLFSNATIEDFNFPEQFLQRRIDFLEESRLNTLLDATLLGFSSLLGGNVEIQLKKESLMEETPYCLDIKIINPDDPEDYYQLPCVKIGLNGDISYIYAIQNYNKGNTPKSKFQKNINRKLYSVGSGLSEDELLSEDIKDTTPAFLVAGAITLGLLDNLEIKEVVLPSLLVERWNAKEIMFTVKKEFQHRKKTDSQVIEDEFVDNQNKHLGIQTNLSDKFIRTFRRLAKQLPYVDIISIPMEADSSLHLTFENSSCSYNEVLDELYSMSSNIKKTK